MWRYNNIKFIYDNPVDSKFNEVGTIDSLTIYIKSKYALMQAIRHHVDNSYLGEYTEIKPRTVKHDTPIKV